MSFLKEDREALIERLKDARDELESTRKELKDMQKELGKSPVADDDSDDQIQILKNKMKKKVGNFQPFSYFFSNDIDEEVGLCLLPWITIKSGGTVWKRSQL